MTRPTLVAKPGSPRGVHGFARGPSKTLPPTCQSHASLIQGGSVFEQRYRVRFQAALTVRTRYAAEALAVRQRELRAPLGSEDQALDELSGTI